MVFWRKNKSKDIEKELANLNLFQFLGNDLPVINVDGYDYINRIWRNVGAVYECTDLIYKKVLNSPLTFYRVKNSNEYRKYLALKDKDSFNARIAKAKSLEEVSIPVLEERLLKPNEHQNYTNFIGVLALSYLVTGNAYIYKDTSKSTGRPIDLYALNELFIESGGMHNPVKAYYQFYQTDNERMYPADSIYHMKTPNISFDIGASQLYGVSPLRAYLEPLRTIEESYKQSSKQMKSGGVLSVIFPRDKEDQFERSQREAFIRGIRKALISNDDFSRLTTSSVALGSEQIGLSAGDLDLLSIRSASEESIYRCYHVPLSRYNQRASTQNNQAESNKQLVYDAVAPLCEVISEALTNHIGVHYDNTIIELDWSKLPEMAVNMREMQDYIGRQVDLGIISRDEARAMFGYGETGISEMKGFYYKGRKLQGS